MVKTGKTTSKTSTNKKQERKVLTWREKLASYNINNISVRYTSDIVIAAELSTDFSEAIEILHDGANSTSTNVMSLNWNCFIQYLKTFIASYTQAKNEDEYTLLFKSAADEAVRHLTSNVFLNEHIPTELAAKLIKLEIIKIIKGYAMSHEPPYTRKASRSSKTMKSKQGVKSRNSSKESIPVTGKEQLYILISGCYDPCIIEELFKCGVKLSGIVEIAYPETIFEGYDCKDGGSKSSTDTIMEFLSLGHTDGVMIYKKSGNTVDVTDSIYSNMPLTPSDYTTSSLNVNLRRHFICHFWTVIYKQLESEFLSDTAHLRISPIYTVVPKKGTPDYELQALEVFSHISREIMKLANAKRQHTNYIKNINICNIDSPSEKISIDSLPMYQKVVNSVPPESVTVSMLLHGLVEEICTRLPDPVKSPAKGPLKKSVSSKTVYKSQCSTEEVCTPLSACTKTASQESTLNKTVETSKSSTGLRKVFETPMLSCINESNPSKSNTIVFRGSRKMSLVNITRESQSKTKRKSNRKQMLVKQLANYLICYRRNYAPLNRTEFLHHEKCFNDPRTKIKLAKNIFTIHETSLLELETLSFSRLFQNVRQIHGKSLLHCPPVKLWRQFKRLKSAQILLDNHLMGNLSAHLQLPKDEITQAMNLTFFKTIACSANTVTKDSTKCDYLFRCNVNAEAEIVEIFESCASSSDISFHLSHTNPHKEQICVKIPYADVIDEPSIYESRNIPTYLWYEKLSAVVALQQINKAYRDYICIDQHHCLFTDSMLLRFHNNADEFGISTKTWQQSIRTRVGLRDFCRYIMHEEANWLKEQEKKYSSKINDSIQLNEAHLQKNPSTSRNSSKCENSFLGYDYGKSRLQLSGGLITFHSLDGYKVTVDKTTLYGQPKKVSINVTIKDNSFIVHYIDKRRTSKEPFMFHFTLADGTIIAFNRPPKINKGQLIIGELIKKRKKRKVKLNPNSTYRPRDKNVFYTVEMEYCDIDFGIPNPLADPSKTSIVAIYRILPMQLTGLINPRNPTIKFVTDGHSFWAGDDISVALMKYSNNCSKYSSFTKNRLISRQQLSKQLLKGSSTISPEQTFTNGAEQSFATSPQILSRNSKPAVTISLKHSFTESSEQALTVSPKHSFTESSEQSFILSSNTSDIDLKSYKYLKPYYAYNVTAAVNENSTESSSELDNKDLYELNLSGITLSKQNSECDEDKWMPNSNNSFIPVSHLTVSYNSSVLNKINEMPIFKLDFTDLHSNLTSTTFSDAFETTCKIVSGNTNASSDVSNANSLHVDKELQQFVLNLPALADDNEVSNTYGKYCVPIQTHRSTILSEIKLNNFIFPSLTFIERGEIEFCPIDITSPSYVSLNSHSGQSITYKLPQNLPLVVDDSNIVRSSSLLEHSVKELETLDLTLSYISLTSLVEDLLMKIDEAKQRQIPLFKILSSKLRKFVYIKRIKSYIHIQIGKNTIKLLCKHPQYKVKKTVKKVNILPIKMSKARFTNDHFYDMKLSLPSGLLIYTIPGINNEPFNIKQQYLHEGPQTKAVVGEESRTFIRSGRLVIRKCDGTIDIVSTNGQMVQCELPHKIERTYSKYSIYNKKIIQNGEHNPLAFKKQEKYVSTRFQRKIQRFVCHVQKHVIGGKYRYYSVFPNLRKTYNKSKCTIHETKDPLKFVLIADDGRKCTITGTRIAYKDKIFQSHHKLRDPDGYQEYYYSRDDGVKCLLTANGVLTTEFYDGTRISTWPIVEPKMIGIDELDGSSWEPTVSTGSSLLSSNMRFVLGKYFQEVNSEQDGWISINIVYKFEHPNYATIIYSRSNHRAKIILPNNKIITATEKGFYTVNVDGLIRTSVNNDHIHIESNLCQSCNQTSITTINVKPMYENIHPASAKTRLLETSDSYKKTFFVNYDGSCCRNSNYIVCHSNNVCCKAHDKEDFQKLFVLNRDLSATKFWDVKAYRERMTEATNYNNSVIEFYDKIANSSEKYRSLEVRTYKFKPYPARFTTSYRYADLLPSKFQGNPLKSPMAYCLTLKIHSQSAIIKSKMFQNFVCKLSEHQANLYKFSKEDIHRYIGMLLKELSNTKTSIDSNFTAISRNKDMRIETKPNMPQSLRRLAVRKYLTPMSLGTDIKLCPKIDLDKQVSQEEKPKKIQKPIRMVDKDIQCGCENKMTSKSRWELLGLRRPRNTYFKPGGKKTEAKNIDMTKLEAKADFIMHLKRLHGKPKQQTKAIDSYIENCIKRERKPSRILATGVMENAYFKIPPTTRVAPFKKQKEKTKPVKTNKQHPHKPKLASEVQPLKQSTNTELKNQKCKKQGVVAQQLSQKQQVSKKSKLKKIGTQQFKSQQPKPMKTGRSEVRLYCTRSTKTRHSAPCTSNIQRPSSEQRRPLSTQRTYICQPNTRQTYAGPLISKGTYIIPPSTERTYFDSPITQSTYVSQPSIEETYISPLSTQNDSPSISEKTYSNPVTQPTYVSQPSIEETYISPFSTQKTYDSPAISEKTYSNPITQRTLVSPPSAQTTQASSPISQGTYVCPPSVQKTYVSSPRTQETGASPSSTQKTYVCQPSTRGTYICQSSTSQASINTRTTQKTCFTQRTYVIQPAEHNTRGTYVCQSSTPQAGFSTPTTQKTCFTQRTYVIQPANQRTHVRKPTAQRTAVQKSKTRQTTGQKCKNASTDTDNLHIIAMLSSIKNKEKEASKYKNWKKKVK